MFSQDLVRVSARKVEGWGPIYKAPGRFVHQLNSRHRRLGREYTDAPWAVREGSTREVL